MEPNAFTVSPSKQQKKNAVIAYWIFISLSICILLLLVLVSMKKSSVSGIQLVFVLMAAVGFFVARRIRLYAFSSYLVSPDGIREISPAGQELRKFSWDSFAFVGVAPMKLSSHPLLIQEYIVCSETVPTKQYRNSRGYDVNFKSAILFDDTDENYSILSLYFKGFLP